LYVFTINSAFYKPHNKKSRGVKSEERGVQGVGLPPPPLLSNNWETPCTQTHEHDGRSRVVHHLTGKLFHRTWGKDVFLIIAFSVNHSHSQELHEDFHFLIHNNCASWLYYTHEMLLKQVNTVCRG
jgi:hypothetical protein